MGGSGSSILHAFAIWRPRGTEHCSRRRGHGRSLRQIRRKNKYGSDEVSCPIGCNSRPPCQAVVYCPQYRHRLRLTIPLFDSLPITSFHFSNQLEGICPVSEQHSPTYFVLRMHLNTLRHPRASHVFYQRWLNKVFPCHRKHTSVNATHARRQHLYSRRI